MFFDGSHRVFSNSDAAVFHLEVLPSLPDGVVVGIHDVLWPDDYLPELTAFWWSEQYVLGAFCWAGPSGFTRCWRAPTSPRSRARIDSRGPVARAEAPRG